MHHFDPRAPSRFGAAVGGSNLPKQQKSDSDDQDGADDADAPVTVTVTVAAKTPTQAAEQKNNEDDNDDDPYRHALISDCMTVRVLLAQASSLCAMFPMSALGKDVQQAMPICTQSTVLNGSGAAG